jgi:radical SAM protein with 4Fe4S-binding SPASM domain
MTNVAARIERVPRACFWEITDACNLRCIHCEADAGHRDPAELTTQEALDLTGELAAAGCASVNLTGGEPLLRRDWPLIARALVDRGVEVTVITNGLLVSEARISRMIDAGVTGAAVSLDGLREAHDTIRVPAAPRRGKRSCFGDALRAIDRLAASPLRTAVITQVHKRNFDDLEAMHELLSGRGVDVWQVQLAMPLGRLWRIRFDYLLDPSQLPDLTVRLARLVRAGRLRIAVADNIGYYSREEPVLRGSLRGTQSFWVGCLAGCRVVAICSNGDVKGCPSHPRQFVVGNVRERRFGEIWADPRGGFVYNTAWDEALLEGGCKKCPFRRLCRAGCTTMAFGATGTIYDNPFCVQRSREQSNACPEKKC